MLGCRLNYSAVRNCGIRFSGLQSVLLREFMERPNELSPSEQIIGSSIEGRVRRGLKTDSTFALNGPPLLAESGPHQMREVISHRRIHQPHCASICFNRWHVSHHELLWMETLTHFPPTVNPLSAFWQLISWDFQDVDLKHYTSSYNKKRHMLAHYLHAITLSTG